MASVNVDLVLDPVCPWCWLGHRYWRSAQALVPHIAVETVLRPFQLDGSIPKAGLPYQAYMKARIGEDAQGRFKAMRAHLEAAGPEAGIVFNFDEITIRPNTMDAHRLIRWAGSPKSPPGAQDRMARRLFELYFEEARDIGDRALLAEAAADCGMDAALVTALLASNADVDAVRGEIDTAARMGVRGVPCFLIEGRYALVGAQEAETIADALRQVAGAKARGELDARD